MPTKEDWIDLSALIPSQFISDGMVVIDYDWVKEHDESKTRAITTHLLRKALRQVGHKITKMGSAYDKDSGRCLWTLYETTITEKQGDKMTELWNDWIGEVEELEYLEHESDDETESVNEDDMEDDPSN